MVALRFHANAISGSGPGIFTRYNLQRRVESLGVGIERGRGRAPHVIEGISCVSRSPCQPKKSIWLRWRIARFGSAFELLKLGRSSAEARCKLEDIVV